MKNFFKKFLVGLLVSLQVFLPSITYADQTVGGFVFATPIIGNSVGNQASFSANLTNSLIPEKANGGSLPTYSRATTASVIDWEGLIKTAQIGEARFTGARRVENLIPKSDNLSVSPWFANGTNATISSGIIDPNGGTTAYQINYPGVNDAWVSNSVSYTTIGTAIFSIWLKADAPGTIRIESGNGTQITTLDASVTTTWKRFVTTPKSGTTVDNQIWIWRQAVGMLSKVYAWHPQVEYVTGQSNQNPSEYVSKGILSAPYHGAGVDGVKYFSTLNGNTVSSNVVTEALGLPINTTNGASSLTTDANGPFGYQAGTQSTNLAIRSQEFETTAWVGTYSQNFIPTANSTTAPDGTLTADTITATGANARISQSIGSITHDIPYTASIWIKRKTGIGAITLFTNFEVTTGVDITSQINSSTWTRVSITETPRLGTDGTAYFVLQLATNNDIIYIWGAQLEQASFASSYIPTTTTAVTRNGDQLAYGFARNASTAQGTWYVETNNVINPQSNTWILTMDSAQDAGMLHNTSTQVSCQGTDYTAVTKSITWSSGNSIVCTFGGTVESIYLNGSSATTGVFNGNMGNGATISIGQNSGIQGLSGNIRRIRIFPTILSTGAIATIH